MNKIKILAIVAIMFPLSNCWSQTTFEIKYGAPEYVGLPIPYDYGFDGNAENGFLLLEVHPGKKAIIKAFDTAGKPGKEATKNIDVLPLKYTTRVKCFANKYYWFYSTWDKSKKKETLYVEELNQEVPSFGGNAKPLIETNEVSDDAVAFNNRKKFLYTTNLNKDKLLITYRLTPTEKIDTKNFDQIGFYVFDNQMQKLWGKQVKMPYNEKSMDNGSFLLANDGTVYYTYKVFDEQYVYHFEVMIFPNNGGDVKKIVIPSGEKYINDLSLMENAKGEILCSGLYANFEKGSDRLYSYSGFLKTHTKSDGFYVYQLDKEGNISLYGNGYFNYPKEIIKPYEDPREYDNIEKSFAKGLVEMENMHFRNLLQTADGNLILVCERNYLFVPKLANSTAYLRYENACIIKFSPDGKIIWSHKIPKYQQVTHTGDYNWRLSGSIFTFLKNDDLHFLYTDNIKNLTVKSTQGPEMCGDYGYMIHGLVNQQGEINRESLFDERKSGSIDPYSMEPTNNGFYDLSFRDYKKRLVFLIYK